MYIGWQHRIFPYAPFDAFVEGLEKLGSSHILKVRDAFMSMNAKLAACSTGITCSQLQFACVQVQMGTTQTT